MTLLLSFLVFLCRINRTASEDVTEYYCPEGYKLCVNGGCAKTEEGCEFVQGFKQFTCPTDHPILCPNLSCVTKSEDCSLNVPQCPPHKPYQCWNNECRKSFDDCPTAVTCPEDYPIFCYDGSCVKTEEDCKHREIKSLTSCIYRCFTGSCAASPDLCPTHVSCGKDEDGKAAKKCWNGACVEEVDECPSPEVKCTGDFSFRCPDGSCRTDLAACSTISTCPASLPVKCFDNSCRASISECPNYQSCGEKGKKISCPDGTCAKGSINSCNTIVTCYPTLPFLCYDHTCKAQLRDCPLPPKCSKNQVLCPNGSCASSRQLCKFFSPCDPSTPTRCSSNICTNTLGDCNRQVESDNLKPTGYVSCGDGTYRRSQALCEEFKCPPNRPYKCPEGVCVHDKELCDVNGCPYNAKFKCPEGTCVDDSSKCLSAEKATAENICGAGKVLCDDGSCAGSIGDCPTKNGCPKEKSLRCADGTCVNPKTSSCNPVHCPDTSPIKCANGFCGKTSSDCPAESREKDIGKCGEGMFMCYDGRCVVSNEYCRPLYNCEAGYVKCSDGSCRVSSDLCPKQVQCPPERPYRCVSSSNLECVENEKDCDNTICPENYKLCSTTGECIANSVYSKNCLAVGAEMNGCPEGKVKCFGGRCLNKGDCAEASNACPLDSSFYLCANGECVDNKSKCSNEECIGMRCDNGRCVSDEKEAVYKCTNNNGCPLSRPYRCSDGSCKQSERQCKTVISCGEDRRYICADGSCVSDTNLCKVYIPCEFRCDKNRLCVDNENECDKYSEYCPIASPVRCPSGTCASSIEECPENVNIPFCSDGEFYCVRMNKCIKNKMDCLKYYNIITEVKSRLLFEEGEEYPSIEGTICYDGTMAVGNEKCPIVPACQIGQYRCESGACAYNKKDCSDESNYICNNGQIKCPDGLCHTSCEEVAFNGCLVGQYQCSNGMCVSSELDCIGYSMCDDPTEPFRCITGKCVSEISQCEQLERLGHVKNITYSFNKNDQISIVFAFDPKGRISGKINIPGNALNINYKYSQIHVEEVSDSAVYNDSLYNNSATFLFNVSNGIIGSEGVLDFENSVMSPIFKIYGATASEKQKFKIPALLTIAHNEYDTLNFNPYDYCLAKLTDYDLENDKLSPSSHWECVERQSSTEQKQFSFTEYGVYAVLLSPLRSSPIIETDYSFFWENIKWILLTALIILVVSAIVYYIFTRIMRYRGKYHENLNKIALLQQQKAEYEQMSTDAFGQTLGDNILGLVYVSNPCYKQEEEKKGSSLEAEIEELQRKCKNVEAQNKRLQEEIDAEKVRYNAIAEEIESEKSCILGKLVKFMIKL